MSNGDLAIDYGTSNTVALVRSFDGRTRQLLFDGSPLFPSAVLSDRDGTLRTGRDAVRSARLDPARYEPNPKRRIDESEVLLGDRVYPLAHLIASTLHAVWREAVRVVAGPPSRVLLTHPVAWGPTRRAVLADACARAGMPAPILVPEPVAAATYFAGLPHVRLGDGQAVVVYDLGAGTFDVSVVRRGPRGFETLGYHGLDDVGGLDLDALVVGHATGGLARTNPAVWQRLSQPRDADDRRHHRLLWDDAREAKESLSRQQSVSFPLPLTGTDALITRGEFETMAGPLLIRTVDVTLAAVRQAGLPPERLAGVFLVGGGSRIPLVATLLHQRQGIAPTALEQPEIVVAEGALSAGLAVPASGGPQYGGAPVSGAPQYGGAPVSGGPPQYGGAPVGGPQYGGAPVNGGSQYGGAPGGGGPQYGAAPVSGGPHYGGAPVSGAPAAGAGSRGSGQSGAGPQASGGSRAGAGTSGSGAPSSSGGGGSRPGGAAAAGSAGAGGSARAAGSGGAGTGGAAGAAGAAGGAGAGGSGAAGSSGRPSLAPGAPLWPGSPTSPAAGPSAGSSAGRPGGSSAGSSSGGPSGGSAPAGPSFPPPPSPFIPPPQDPYRPTADDPFGPPPALNVPEAAPLWPSDVDAPLGPSSAPGRPGGPSRSGSAGPPARSSGPSQSGPSQSGPSQSGPAQSGPARSGPSRSGGSSPAGGRPTNYPPPYPDPARQQQNVAHQPSSRPVNRAGGTTVRSRSRARFQWTDPLWLVPGAIWIAVAVAGTWQRPAVLLALTSISIAILGFAIDSRTHRRLPWWAKGVIPLVVGFGLGYLFSGVGGGVLVFGVVLLMISVGVAVLLLRPRTPGR